jgi:secreted PhoX family phosphatase
VVYLTEDRPDGLLYRYLPLEQGRLLAGGRMQALRLADDTRRSTRNYSGDGPAFPLRTSLPVAWIDVDDINSPRDDLRVRGHAAGAALFARGEGAWFGNGSIYFACTDGGPAKSGQIFRYTPSPGEGTPAESGAPGRLELYLEPNDARLLEACDNVTVAPWGDLIICEDGSGDQYLRLVTKSGELLTLARNAASKAEFAGACFAPGHDILFVNIFNPGMTLAIRGPWPGRA